MPGARRIVLVDDEADILDATSELLRLHGYEVTVVGDAARILEVLRRERPDLLLQDCAMPGLDLQRLVDAIRADDSLRGLPVVLFTGSVDAYETARRIKVAGFIEKPFDFVRLTQEIERVLVARAKSA